MIINQELCKGCNLCVSACKKNIIKIDKNIINSKGYNPLTIIDKDKCNNCKMCSIICPDSAIISS